MATFYRDSGSADGSVSGSLRALASEFEAPIAESRIGHRIGARVPFVAPSTRATFSYLQRSSYVDASGLNRGIRAIGQKPPQGEPGEWSTVSGQLKEFGELVNIDHSDGYVLGDVDSELDRDELGVKMSLTRCLDVIDMYTSNTLNAGTSPWTATDEVGTDWEDSAVNPLSNIMAALQSHEDTDGCESMPGGRVAMVCGTRVYRSLLQNSNLTALFGGNIGMGVLSGDQLLSCLASVGVGELLVGTDARWGSIVTLYQKAPGGVAATPNGRLVESAGVICAHAGSQLIDTAEPETSYRTTGYYVFSNCAPAVVIPEFGIRIEGVYS
jgi:hypothetical protein